MLRYRFPAFVFAVFLLALTSYFWAQHKTSYLEIPTAYIEAVSTVMHSDISGRIRQMGPIEGESVCKDQTLFVVDQDFVLAKQIHAKYLVENLESQIELEKERMGKAMDAYLMATTEMELGIGSMDQVKKQLVQMEDAQEKSESALKNLSDAKSVLQLLDLELEKMTMTAPFDGVILKRTKNPGSVVSFGDPIYVLCDLKQVWVEAEVLEDDLAKISIGTRAEVRLAAYPKIKLTGKVSYIGAATVAKSSFMSERVSIQSIPIKVSIEEPPFPLRPGLSAKLKLVL